MLNKVDPISLPVSHKINAVYISAIHSTNSVLKTTITMILPPYFITVSSCSMKMAVNKLRLISTISLGLVIMITGTCVSYQLLTVANK